MKMVIVFDTEDKDGMENTIKMVDHLATEYLGRGLKTHHKRAFGKIEFIKVLRNFAKKVKAEEATGGQGDSLRFAKQYSEEVWDAKMKGNRYP